MIEKLFDRSTAVIRHLDASILKIIKCLFHKNLNSYNKRKISIKMSHLL